MMLFEKKEYNRYLLFQSRPRMPTLDELARGNYGNVGAVIKQCAWKRSHYGAHTRGYVPSRSMRHIGDIPVEVYHHKELGKYFAKGMDAHERKKESLRFFRRYPQFATVEKL